MSRTLPGHPARVILLPHPGLVDAEAESTRREAESFLGLKTGAVRVGKIFTILAPLDAGQLEDFARRGLADRLIHEVWIDRPPETPGFASYLIVSKLPGVTDDEGASAQKTLQDLLGLQLDPSAQHIFSHTLYLFENELSGKELRRLGEELLGNPLIHRFDGGSMPVQLDYVPLVSLIPGAAWEEIDLDLPDEDLLRLAESRLLSLNLEEMKAIQAYFATPARHETRRANGMGQQPTDCELEIFAQTWSEHCKHKEFNALIRFRDLDRRETQEIDSLFRTYIQAPTREIWKKMEEAGYNWLVKVFSDNAGIVRLDADRLLAWKVETHNSPSALDPYGGSITGILGNNRDAFGTGRGGGRPLFNTDVLCFGPPDYHGPLAPGQLHPRRILEGVVQGIRDGGNKSGIPTVNGAVVFDDRFRGKPLVFCGTAAIMPASYQGQDSWEKEIRPGDRIVMAGGRVGNDGIHGATFSSLELNERSPRSAVQIGSPITQKILCDFLEQACRAGLVRCCTDNGAGGLSSSVGELAAVTGGAEIHLERVPLKYMGLKPWEIFLSESQERMTLVVDPAQLGALYELAAIHEVELSDLGRFTDDGLLRVSYQEEPVALLELEFLHHGVPRKRMEAEWSAPPPCEPKPAPPRDPGETLLRLLASPNICSREWIIRQYDHEVKGRSVLKPLMGGHGIAPQDAAVLRLNFDSYAGVAVSCGILPRYGDLDPYWMSAGAFDEAVRAIIAVGGGLPRPGDPEGPFWTANDNFCLPDCAYDPHFNPDGKRKLGALVRMCQALRDLSLAYRIPLTSGKDSMKNDFRLGGVKISIPPTVLYSMVSAIPDVRRVVSADWKVEGDRIYMLGRTYDELGGSEYYRLLGEPGGSVPQVRTEDALHLYGKVWRANQENLLESCHDLSDGGLAVAAAESLLGSGLGAELDAGLPGLTWESILFSESHSRFLVTVRPERVKAFEALFYSDCQFLGRVTGDKCLRIRWEERVLADLPVSSLEEAWRGGVAW